MLVLWWDVPSCAITARVEFEGFDRIGVRGFRRNSCFSSLEFWSLRTDTVTILDYSSRPTKIIAQTTQSTAKATKFVTATTNSP